MEKPSGIFMKLGIRARLILAYIFLISIPMCIIGIQYFISTRDMIYDIVQKNVHEIVKKNNEVLDSRLKKVKDNCWELMSDNEFIDKSSSTELDNTYKMVSMDIELTKILNKYFLSSQDITSVQLMTSTYAFGYSAMPANKNRNYISVEAFGKSELYESAVAAKGKLEWFPTYDFDQMFKQTEGIETGPGNKHMFAALQIIKTSNITFTETEKPIKTSENPVLMITFGENFYRDLFKNSITMKSSYFFVITKDGRFVSHQEKDKVGKKASFSWLEGAVEKSSGQDVVEIDGKKTLICFDTSRETGWISVIAIDNGSLLGDIFSSLKLNSVYIVIALTVIPILISYFVSDMISKPITKLSRAIKKTGDGDFSIKIPEEGNVEFKSLISRFNSMNEKIHKLIAENYEIKIKEKEAEINALTLQLDPHFMYNTLNMVNLKLIQNGQDETSQMISSLSAMLRFTARNKSALVAFEPELDYLKGYIYIMSMRFEGRFCVEYDIDPGLFDYSVPKFLLQPFVENSLIHGFEGMKEGGFLKISCRLQNSLRVFIIEDNGKGISEEKIKEIMEGRTNSVGIQNIRYRIRIIYGAGYDINIQSVAGEGTKVTLILPIT